MEKKSETIQYIPKALQDRLIALGFTELSERTVSREGKAFTEYGITIEQAERWMWKEHRELFFFILPTFQTWEKGNSWEYCFPAKKEDDNSPQLPDPFAARLAGVERVIEILEGKNK